MRLLLPAAVLGALLGIGQAASRTLTVGPGQEFERPSVAARVATDGDTLLIEPGTYYDCVVSRVAGLTIAGRAPGVVLTDTACQGKAILVLGGGDVTVRDLTLARARVDDGNGAGVRLEGPGATFERVRFLNNQAGVLGGTGRITVTDCIFEGGGVGGARQTYALNIGPADSVEVAGSTFGPTRGGQVRSTAARTTIRATSLDMAAPGAAVEAAGDLVVDGATLRLFGDAETGVRVTDGGATIRNTRLANETGRPVALLLHWGRGTPVLDGNTLPPGDAAVSTSGYWRHEASTAYHGAKDTARSAAGSLKRGLQDLLR